MKPGTVVVVVGLCALAIVVGAVMSQVGTGKGMRAMPAASAGVATVDASAKEVKTVADVGKDTNANANVDAKSQRVESAEARVVQYYPNVPDKITTPEMAVEAYFDALCMASFAAPPDVQMKAGTVGMEKEPYPVAYGYWDQAWQAKHRLESFVNSWKGTLHVQVLKLLPAGDEQGNPRFFVETKTLEGVGEGQPRTGYFYYTGFFTVKDTPDGWRITDGKLEPENLAWQLGGHQPWRGDANMVAQVEIGGRVDAPIGKPVQEKQADGTITVRFLDANGKEVHVARCVVPEDGMVRVIEKK